MEIFIFYSKLHKTEKFNKVNIKAIANDVFIEPILFVIYILINFFFNLLIK